ncbi:DUF3016 domain-containing protein [Solilutibacter silvestris]|uniref:DUF3016 domain-containing protein n=1 Tax=Solilutibacter silvestris TaxID=1645665 RepID=A0A2K1Q2U5_9GAMM|nr:DUF3016 domain-containing protein [Lysobacter silvestris]PNS09344.1 hypothetical protein Lysil_0973 [Lysobacter silvestris]
MRTLTIALASALLAACAATPARDPQPLQLPANDRVNVSWADPASFSEHSCDFAPGGRDNAWVGDLAKYTRDQAMKRLPAGAHLDVRFIDIDRAGECRPDRMGSEQIRIIRDIYPPRITLHYRLSGTGVAAADADARLSDLAFMMNPPGLPGNSDPLRYEKRVIDDWLRKLLGKR